MEITYPSAVDEQLKTLTLDMHGLAIQAEARLQQKVSMVEIATQMRRTGLEFRATVAWWDRDTPHADCATGPTPRAAIAAVLQKVPVPFDTMLHLGYREVGK